ncbi:MAG: hypothetical protein SX243_19360 [Acidobacteriota bacterium]|nr:hypothetical protein [Acidobacteriota bacterium]
MKLWMFFVVGAFLAWGCYVPTIHAGQVAFKGGSLRAFLFVGLAYFLTAVLVPLGLLGAKMEPWEFTTKGMALSTTAGVFGAVGALCVILAMKTGGSPIVVAPLVFAGAPVIATLVSMTWHKPKTAPEIWFYIGLVLAASGAAMVLRFRPH